MRRLKALAKQQLIQGQGKVVLQVQEAATLPVGEVSTLTKKWQRRLARRRLSDSAGTIRKDRGR